MKDKQKDLIKKDIISNYGIKKSKIFMEYLKCKRKYKVNYFEYLSLYFPTIPDMRRSEILTRRINEKLINDLNPFELRYKIVSKNEFNHLFDKYIKRDWLLLDDENNEEFRLFIKSREQIVIPSDDNKKSHVIDIANCNEWQLHQELINTHNYIVEELVKHHKIFDEIDDKSLITVKFITLKDTDTIHLLGSYVDIELNEEKYYIPIDLKTGKTYSFALNNYIKTNKVNNWEVKSFKIPNWKKALKMVSELPLITPELEYISWDIAITNDDIVLIEASDEPDYHVLQHPDYLKDNKGLLEQIKEIKGGNL